MIPFFDPPYYVYEEEEEFTFDMKVDKSFHLQTNEISDSILLFDEPYFKIIAACNDDTIRVFDSRTFRRLEILMDHQGDVNHLVKWNEEVWLSCSNDSKILRYTVNPEIRLIKKLQLEGLIIKKMLKLNNDKYLIYCLSGELYVMSYSRNRIHRYLTPQGLCYSNSVLILSHQHKNCFYMNNWDINNSVKRIDYLRNEEEVEFKEHGGNPVLSMTTFLSPSNEEYLIVGGDFNYFYIYRSTFCWCINELVKKIMISRNYGTTDTLSANTYMSIFNNKYLCCGDESGMFHIYELFQSNIRNRYSDKNESIISIDRNPSSKKRHQHSILKTLEKKIHSGKIIFFNELRNKRLDTSITIFSCSSGDENLNFTRIFGLENNLICGNHKNLVFQKEDNSERIGFLKNEQDKFLYLEKKKKGINKNNNSTTRNGNQRIIFFKERKGNVKGRKRFRSYESLFFLRIRLRYKSITGIFRSFLFKYNGEIRDIKLLNYKYTYNLSKEEKEGGEEENNKILEQQRKEKKVQQHSKSPKKNRKNKNKKKIRNLNLKNRNSYSPKETPKSGQISARTIKKRFSDRLRMKKKNRRILQKEFNHTSSKIKQSKTCPEYLIISENNSWIKTRKKKNGWKFRINNNYNNHIVRVKKLENVLGVSI